MFDTVAEILLEQEDVGGSVEPSAVFPELVRAPHRRIWRLWKQGQLVEALKELLAVYSMNLEAITKKVNFLKNTEDWILAIYDSVRKAVHDSMYNVPNLSL